MLFLIVHSFSFVKAFNVTVPERTLQITDGKPLKQQGSCKCVWGAFLGRLALLYFPTGRSCRASLEGWRWRRWLFETNVLTLKKQSVPSPTVLAVRSRSDRSLADFTQDGPGTAWAGRFQEVRKFDQGTKKQWWRFCIRVLFCLSNKMGNDPSCCPLFFSTFHGSPLMPANLRMCWVVFQIP